MAEQDGFRYVTVTHVRTYRVEDEALSDEDVRSQAEHDPDVEPFLCVIDEGPDVEVFWSQKDMGVVLR